MEKSTLISLGKQFSLANGKINFNILETNGHICNAVLPICIKQITILDTFVCKY